MKSIWDRNPSLNGWWNLHVFWTIIIKWRYKYSFCSGRLMCGLVAVPKMCSSKVKLQKFLYNWTIVFCMLSPLPSAKPLLVCFQPYPMTDVDPKNTEEFASCGRTGRRNALADILDSNLASTSTASLPNELQKLQCTGNAGFMANLGNIAGLWYCSCLGRSAWHPWYWRSGLTDHVVGIKHLLDELKVPVEN